MVLVKMTSSLGHYGVYFGIASEARSKWYWFFPDVPFETVTVVTEEVK
jgi:hypothetical protein